MGGPWILQLGFYKGQIFATSQMYEHDSNILRWHTADGTLENGYFKPIPYTDSIEDIKPPPELWSLHSMPNDKNGINFMAI